VKPREAKLTSEVDLRRSRTKKMQNIAVGATAFSQLALSRKILIFTAWYVKE
jgi:hypothetical protein